VFRAHPGGSVIQEEVRLFVYSVGVRVGLLNAAEARRNMAAGGARRRRRRLRQMP